jgi:spore germination protein YaaH
MTRRLAGALVPLALALALASTLGPGAAAAGPSPADDREPPAVTGFALGSLRPQVVHRDAAALTTVSVAGIGLRPDGARVAAPTTDMQRLARAAHRDGLRAELLVNNYSNLLEAFDPRAAHRLLASRRNIRGVADEVAAHVRAQDWDGVNVDLERVRAADARRLVTFVAALQGALPDNATVSIDVSAATSVRAYRDRGYALAALGRAADVVVVMAYDQHGPTWSDPGPVGDLRWQREAMRAAASVVPADRLDLGVAGYGYTWPREGVGRSVRIARAWRMVERDDVRATWHRRSGEWSARLDDGTVMWWSDGRSYRARLRLAERLGVHGVAVWRLGSADPLVGAGRAQRRAR